MNRQAFESAKAKYDAQAIQEERKPLYEKREDFVNRFPVASIMDMSIEEYAIGTGKHESFCYGLEFGLSALGKISSRVGSDKFGVYYSEGEYKPTKRYGETWNDAFVAVKKSIANLLDAGHRKAIEEIVSNPLCATLKGRMRMRI